MAKIFLSHSSLNNAQAMAIRAWLASEGWDDVFLDLDPERGIKAGERWQEALKRASSTCELVLFLVSPAWAASKWCIAEFLLAKQMNKRIFAAIVEQTSFEMVPIEMTSEWQIVDLTTGAEMRHFPVVSLAGEKPHVVRFSTDGLDRLKIGLLGAGLDPKFFPWPPEHDPHRPPYRGLRALEEEDAGIFFGRDGPIVDGLDLLRRLREAAPPRMLVILGASGAGKSSFVRAGLLPRLRRDSRYYRVLPVIRPHDAVLEGDAGLIGALERALREIKHPRPRAEIRKACSTGAQAVAELIAALVEPTTAGTAPPTLILPIDQGEELFLAGGVDEGRACLGLLHDLLLLDRPAIAALVTIRSDSYEPLQAAPALEGIAQQTYSLPPMPRGAYGEVICGPARRLSETVGTFEIDGALVDALLGDIGESAAKDALPLLAFTLERLYREYGAAGNLKLAGYESTGRIRGSIEAAVEQALKAADDHPAIPRERVERLRLLRRAMIPALAGVDPDTGTPRRRVARLDEIPAEARPLVQLLIDQHLLVTDVSQETGETTVEPAHEALLRQWSTLEGWLDEECEDLAMAESVRRAARDWEANRRDGEWVAHAGGRLQLGNRIAAREDFTNLFGPRERAYIAACHEAEEARRAAEEAARRREIVAQKQRRNIFAGAFVVSLVLLAVAGWQWWEAQRQEQEAVTAARTAEYRQYVAESRERTRTQLRPLEGARLGLRALGFATTPAERERAEAVLLEALFEAGFVVLDGHDGDINAMSLNSDGRVATVSSAPCIIVWDPATDWNATVIRGHAGPIYDVDFAPADGRLVTASKDGTARVWSAGGGEELVVVNVGAEVLHASFSPDGNSFATGARNGDVMLWNSGTGREMINLGSANGHTAPVTSLEFAPGGERIVTASEDGTAKIWDLDSGTLVAELNHRDLDVPEQGLAASNQVHAATFSPDGLHVATAAHDGTVRIWHVESGVLVAFLDQHAGLVEDVEFSPDGQLIVTAGSDGGSIVWAWRRDQVQATFEHHRGHVYSVDVSPNGSSVVSGADDGTALVWDLRSGALEETFAGHSGAVWGARFTPDGKHVVTFSSDGTARIWERRVTSLAGHDDDVYGAVFEPSGALIATASADGTARLWDAGDGTFIRSFEDPGAEAEREIYGVAFSPDGDSLVTAARDGSIQLWEVGSGNILQDAERASTVPAVDALYPLGGGPIIGAYADGTLRWWPDGDLKDDVRETRPHTGPIHSLQLSPAGTFVVSVSWDDTAVLFETSTGTELHRFEGHEHDVVVAAFSPDEKRVVTGSMDGSARVWDTASGVELAVLDLHKGPVVDVAFSPSGSRIATASWDDTAAIWSAQTFQPTAHLRGHSGRVAAVRFVGEQLLVTASWDGDARVWHAATGLLVATLGGHLDKINAVTVSPDGSSVVTPSNDDTARIWKLGYANGMDVEAAAQDVLKRQPTSVAACSSES